MSEVTVDEHGCTCLAGVRTQAHEKYRATEYPDGTITLVPAARVHAKLGSAPDADRGDAGLSPERAGGWLRLPARSARGTAGR
jgi:hypothetical protein